METVERETTVAEDFDRLLPASAVRAALSLSERTMRRWIACGKFPRADVQVCRSLRWRESTILGWVRERERERASP